MNPSSFSEEKITAYALNELSPAERREVEAEIAENPELKAELEAIQLLAGQLKEELSLEAVEFEKSPIPIKPHRSDLSDQSNINTEPEDEKIISFRRHPWFYMSGLLAAAACAALMFLPSLSVNLNSAKKSEISPLATKPASPTVEESFTVPTQSMAQLELEPDSPEDAPVSEPMEVVAMDTVEADQDGTLKNEAAGAKKIISVFGAQSEDLKASLSTRGNAEASASVQTANQDLSLSSSALAQAQAQSVLVDNQSSLTGVPFTSTPNNAGAGRIQSSNNDARALAKESPVTTATAKNPGSKTLEAQALAQYNARRDKALVEVESGYSAPNTTTVPVVGDLPLVGRLFANKTSGGEAGYSDTDKSSRRSAGVSATRANASGEAYLPITDNPFLRVADQALSTFSIDVDTGSYTNLRRFLNQGQLPPPDAVRIEELVNYFNYNYPQPKGEDPFSVNTEVAKAPWKNDHLLVRIGLQGKTVAAVDRPAANLVFLIDVSGSMQEPNKLPLVIDSMKLLVQKLKPEDRVGIAVYAGNSGMVLPSTSVSHRGEILEALSGLRAGGSTNGAMGIQLAYDMAKAHYIEGGINRVILCTDGDFNVGVTNRGDLIKLIEEKAKSKVFLSVFGFGMGNLQDATLEQLANKGNGNYGYIDNPKEAKRVFVDQVGGTLQTIAKDVKIQVEFNPAVVSSYRLIGYENRMLAAKDFNDDKKDAGEIGAGHRVTALYEIVPVGVKEDAASIDPLKYQKPAPVEYAGDKSEIMNVKLRYKQPEGDTSKLLEHPVKNENILSFTAQKSGWFRSAPEVASPDFQFAAGVAAFGMILRDSPYMGETDFNLVLQLAGKGSANKQEDRTEFITLVKKARTMFNPDTKPTQHAF